MNKNTKIWINYLAGGAISFFLLWNIYNQVTKQAPALNNWHKIKPGGFLLAGVGLLFFNTSLEALKWFLLTRSVDKISYFRAYSSYLAGIAFSIITPNRVGEYPGRILYLGRAHTFRYINVSILGVTSQLSAVYIFGLLGLVYYNFSFPGILPGIALAICLMANAGIAIIYWQFEEWLPRLNRFAPLRRFVIYGRLLNRVSGKRQILILAISLLRVSIFTAQFLFLLRCMNVEVPLAGGFCMSALFFWIMAVIPSVALTELGIRGSVSLYLFKNFFPLSDANNLGIVSASAGLWLLNLIIPSVFGCLCILGMRLFR